VFVKEVSHYKKGDPQYELILKGKSVFKMYSESSFRDEVGDAEGLRHNSNKSRWTVQSCYEYYLKEI